ncbi:MAG TPA: hypothetical protein VF329_07435 [Gammaproteobacteria bacterium]
MGSLFSMAAYSQSLPPLPEGNAGIAASYPNDAGITSDDEVLFADGFEYDSPNQFVSEGDYYGYYQQSNFALDESVHFGGSKALRIRMPASGGEVSNALVRNISPSDVLFMRVYARFQEDYQGISFAHNGLRITGNYSGPGSRPDGTDFFLVNIENSTIFSEQEPGYTHAYVYHPEQDDVYGEHWYPDGTTSNGSQSFGENFVPRPNVVPARGEWICYEVMVKLNTPGSRDGRVAVWQDGELIADWPNIRFRDVESLKIDQIQLENGGQSSSQRNDKWYDNLVIATSYIGPMNTGSAVALPKAPTDLRAE